MMNIENLNLSDEVISLLKKASTKDEIVKILVDNGASVDESLIDEYLASQKSGAMADDELENVAGGACGKDRTLYVGKVVSLTNSYKDRQNCNCPAMNFNVTYVSEGRASHINPIPTKINLACNTCGKEVLDLPVAAIKHL